MRPQPASIFIFTLCRKQVLQNVTKKERSKKSMTSGALTNEEAEQITDMIWARVIKRLKAREDESGPISFKDFCRKYLPRKSYSWIKYYLIKQCGDEVLITKNPNGWLTAPDGRGKPIKVLSQGRGARWIRQALNTGKLDLNAPEPVTLARRAGLAKPIKRRNSSK